MLNNNHKKHDKKYRMITFKNSIIKIQINNNIILIRNHIEFVKRKVE